MNKRQFIQALAGTLPALGGSTFALASRKTRNWVWITLEREQPADAWKRDFARMRAAGIDAVIPEVYDGRQAYWASNRLPVHAERLEMLLPLAKSEGLEVHAWMWCMPCMLESVLARHADWYNVNAMGQSAADKPAYVDYYRFLDPAHPEVREFIQGTVTELAGIDGLAGVHLDYIRHPDAILPKGLWAKYGLVQDRVYPEFDYGYTPYSRSVFKKKHGVDPLQIEDPLIHEAWFKYRLDSVTDLVNDFLVPAVHARGKQITAAVFPGPTMAREMVRQDWGRWKLDAFMPMLYHDFYEAGAEWVLEQTREGVRAVDQPIYSGLFVPSVVAPGLSRIIAGALTGGAAGVALFHAHAMDEPLWNAFSAAL
ncbi:MAG: family 10 glycosylhydrolase [Steroidobacteraceae bacterium]